MLLINITSNSHTGLYIACDEGRNKNTAVRPVPVLSFFIAPAGFLIRRMDEL